MFFEPVIETEDKSVYADSLAELTGKSRSFWGKLPIEKLRVIYHRIERTVQMARTWKGEIE